ncbi:hypothetical protein K525DRAFT_275438, partial [Schizophyllum commune Loenen D]
GGSWFPPPITPRCPTSHPDSLSILEPGNPRLGCGSGACAFLTFALFFCFILFLLGFGRPPTTTIRAEYDGQAEVDEKTRETPASSPEDPDVCGTFQAGAAPRESPRDLNDTRLARPQAASNFPKPDLKPSPQFKT